MIEQPLNGRTPELFEVIQEAVRAKLIDTHVALPGKIKTYDHSTQKASVEILIKQKLKNSETEIAFPILNDVPVQWSGGKDSFLHFPLDNTCSGLLVFCDRSIDSWVISDGSKIVGLEGEVREHDLSDAIFFPTINTFENPKNIPDNSNVSLNHGNITTQLINTGDGKIKIENSSAELIDLLIQLVDGLIATTVATSMGPQKLSISLDSTLANLKTLITTFKG